MSFPFSKAISFLFSLLFLGDSIGLGHSQVIDLDEENFDSVVLNPNSDVFVAFVAHWCGHCRTLQPILNELAASMPSMMFARLDADQYSALGGKYNIDGYPTIKLFLHDRKEDPLEYRGDRSKKHMASFIQKYVDAQLLDVPMELFEDQASANAPDVEAFEGQFTSYYGEFMSYKTWTPKKAQGVVIFLHGELMSKEAAARYAYVFIRKRLAVYSFDQQGWGEYWSKGPGHVSESQLWVDDVQAFVSFVRTLHATLPFFLVGHSFGALVSIKVLVKDPSMFRAAVLVAPFFERAKPVAETVVEWVAGLVYPAYELMPPYNMANLTRDPEIIKQWKEEEKEGLVRWKYTIGFIRTLRKLQSELALAGRQILLPIQLFLAGDEHVVSNRAAEAFFKLVKSAEKKLVTWPDRRHDIAWDIGFEEPLTAIMDFFLFQTVHAPETSQAEESW